MVLHWRQTQFSLVSVQTSHYCCPKIFSTLFVYSWVRISSKNEAMLFVTVSVVCGQSLKGSTAKSCWSPTVADITFDLDSIFFLDIFVMSRITC